MLFRSKIPGRTDRLPIHVYSGAYVIPADIVSGLGEGNTLAGNEVIKRMFFDEGSPLRKGRGGRAYMTDKYGLHGHYHQKDPESDKGRNLVAAIVAGGEFVIPPRIVEEIGEGDMDQGHALLDAFVISTRKNLTKKLQSLPGPAQD